MRVIGIDPGVAVTGYGVVERTEGRLNPIAAGVIRTDSSTPQAARLARLRLELGGLLSTCRPDVAAVERLFFNSNVKTAMAVGQASGVVLLSLAEAGLEVAEYTPPEIKLAVVGSGGASKFQVQAMVSALLGLAEPLRPADAADACALAIAHLNRSRLTGAVAAARRGIGSARPQPENGIGSARPQPENGIGSARPQPDNGIGSAGPQPNGTGSAR